MLCDINQIKTNSACSHLHVESKIVKHRSKEWNGGSQRMGGRGNREVLVKGYNVSLTQNKFWRPAQHRAYD
jgi:hypothetical protein